MTKHPNKKDDDEGEDWFDSNRHREDLKAKIQIEAIEKQQAEAAEAVRVAEDREIKNFRGLPQEGETRDQLLERIREMRKEPPKKDEPEVFRSEGLQKTFDAEQEVGRAAVARAEAEMELSRVARQKAEAEGGKK
jgi:hypothetical protein